MFDTVASSLVQDAANPDRAAVVAQLAVEHPAHDVHAAMGVLGEPGRRSQHMFIVGDQGTERDVARVVMRSGREAVPGDDARLLDPGAAGRAANVDRHDGELCDTVHANSSSADQVLTILSTGTAAGRGSLAAVGQPVELTRGVGVGIDGHQAPGLDGEAEQPLGRIETLRAAVDLDRDAEPFAGGEDDVCVEL